MAQDLVDRMRRAAMRCDTVVARAFRVALGLPAKYSGPRPRTLRPSLPDPYGDVGECFANERRVRI